MFVEVSARVDASLADVEKTLDQLRADLEGWASVAYREGEQLQARVGPSESLAKVVTLDIGMAELHRYGLSYPVHWSAAGARLLFPELTADLVLSKRGKDETELTLRGTYQPPMGVFGRLADRALLGRVAEATVKSWVEQLAAALSSESQLY
ncbi:MAG TPA: hypothetical protein VF115_05385 [Acidimicrobiia bacterium]